MAQSSDEIIPMFELTMRLKGKDKGTWTELTTDPRDAEAISNTVLSCLETYDNVSFIKISPVRP